MTAQPPTNSQGSGPGVCGHCGTSIPPGGQKKCPLKHLKSSEAQTKILGFFQKQFSEEDKSLKSLFLFTVLYIYSLLCLYYLTISGIN